MVMTNRFGGLMLEPEIEMTSFVILVAEQFATNPKTVLLPDATLGTTEEAKKPTG